jgi:MFS family permease
MKRVGRRVGTMFGLSLAFIGALLCAYATYTSHFITLASGSVFLGASMAFVAQMRFAAIESLNSPIDAPKAISVLMIGGMFAAIIGPEIAVIAKDWVDSPYGFTGSFLALSVLILISILVVSLLKPTEIKQHKVELKSRPLSHIIKQPIFIVAVCSGAIAYSVMSYVMTAAPLSMHAVEGHDLGTTKWVIQSHIIAMYLPSLFSAFLIRHIGIVRLMLLGCVMYCLVVVIALSGRDVMHYWWTMVLLGIGWNFLYTSGTLLLPQAYQDNERFKVQATNDFSIFLVQAMASLSAGLILFSHGWSNLIKISIPIILIMFIISSWYFLILKQQDKTAV